MTINKIEAKSTDRQRLAEQEGNQSGYLLVNKGNYKNNSMYFNETPKRGEKTHINLRFTQERISNQNLEVQVEHFLRSEEDSI